MRRLLLLALLFAPFANAGAPLLQQLFPPVPLDRQLQQTPILMLAVIECCLAAAYLLTLITDGVVEARNEAGELFGFERTAQFSSNTAEAIAQAAQAFGQEDDITVLTVRSVTACA
jgi:hypothetical protein